MRQHATRIACQKLEQFELFWREFELLPVARGWGWALWRVALLFVPLIAVALVFLGANMVKILEGGYVPLLVAALVLMTMRVWVKGTKLLAQKDRAAEMPLTDLLAMLERRPSLSCTASSISRFCRRTTWS